MKNITCPVCGKENDINNKYCISCDSMIQVVKRTTPIIVDEKEIDENEASPIENVNSNIMKVLKNNEAKEKKEASREGVAASSVNSSTDLVSDFDINKMKNEAKKMMEKASNKSSGSLTQEVLKESDTYLMDSMSTTDDRDDDLTAGGGGSPIKFNHMVCPFCGFLNKQNQFFCQQCGCDLKYAQTVKVPMGDMETLQDKYNKPVLKQLIEKSAVKNPDEDIKQFLTLAGNRSIKAGNWKLGREMSLESTGFTLNKLSAGGMGIAYIIFRNVFRGGSSSFIIFMFIVVPLIMKFINSRNDQGLTVVINDAGVEVWDNKGNNNNKERSIKWEDVEYIKVIGKGNKKKLSLFSSEDKKTCNLPAFSEKKRAMLLNTFAIIANSRGIQVLDESQ